MKINLLPSALYSENEYHISKHRLHHSVFNLDWIEDPKVIFDVGAWDFGDSIRFKQRFPDCEVYSFELLPENFEKFSPLAESFGVITRNLGISNQEGFFEYYEAKHQYGDNAQSSLLEPSEKYLDKYGQMVRHEKSKDRILCATIETICFYNEISNIDVLHIDVEGAEYEVIEGLGKIRPNLIFAEFLIDGGWINQKSFEETSNLLINMGYKEVKSMGHDKLFLYSEIGEENE